MGKEETKNQNRQSDDQKKPSFVHRLVSVIVGFWVYSAGLFVLFIIFGGLANSLPELGLVVAFVVLAVSAIAVFRPLPRLFLRSRFFSAAVFLFVGVPALYIANDHLSGAAGARLEALRQTDPDAFLKKLELTDKKRWLNELESLDPDRYEAELRLIDKQKEEARLQASAGAVAERADRCGPKNATMAYVMSQDAVRSYLKAPSTAEFPWVTEISARPAGDCKFEIAAYVDAQNSFGAMIRTRYSATVRHFPDDGTWSVLRVNVVE